MDIYVTPNGDPGGAGAKANPTTLQAALTRAACSNTIIKMATGTYTISSPITGITSNITLEGGFDAANNWRKTSQAGATRILRTNQNVEGCSDGTNAPRLVALQISNASNFRLQDLTVEGENAPAASSGCASGRGVSTYALYLSNCSNYQIVRCRFIVGNGGAGLSGSPGAAGRNAAAHQTPPSCGQPGDQDNCGWTNGAGGSGATVPWGANGGNGGNGGYDNNLGNSGATSPCGGNIVCSGGGGGSGGNSCGASLGCDCNNANNWGVAGQNGGNGNPGSPGTAGPAGSAGVWFVPGGQGGTGGQGQHGRGGGGGGGGGQTNLVCDWRGTGAGGGGGGAGGEGGFGGTGGWGGGGAFCIYLHSNSGGQFVDCEFNTPAAGAGGAGGPGGAGGAGSQGAGQGGNPTTCPRDDCDIGYGGRGGNGGNGGQGGTGGSGSAGLAARIQLVSGSAPTLIQGGTPIAVSSGSNNPASFGLSSQPVITASDIACTNTDVNFSAANSAAWTFGAGATPATANTNNQNVQYSSTGRKTISYSGNTYTDFWNILIPNQTPTITASATSICPGTAVSFTADLTGINYQW
ncbi:MAG: hypothetical protein ABDH91_08950 [Bacteroidia bacterium]